MPRKKAENAETAETTEVKKTTTKKAAGPKQAKTEEMEIPAVDELLSLKEQNRLLMEQMKEMQKQMEEMKTASPQIIHYDSRTELVHFLWMAPVADTNEVDFGQNGRYGRITGKTGSFSVPKDELSRLLTSEVRFYLAKRWLVVVDGLTQDEREALNVDYKQGEVLDKQMFQRIVESGSKILDAYPRLCDEHRNIIAKTYFETWTKAPYKINRDIVLKLYRTDKNVAYQKIIEGMNAADLNVE